MKRSNGVLVLQRRLTLADKIAQWGEKLQCVVGQGHTPFGKAQQPELWDYADGVNTMAFLANL